MIAAPYWQMPPGDVQQIHIIDTDVLVNIRDVYKDSATIWEKVIAEIVAGRLKIVRQVYDELERRFPEVHRKVRPYRTIVLIPDRVAYCVGVVAEVRAIHRNHPGLYKRFGNNNSADPMMIAAAKEMNAIVVTDEKTQGAKSKRRIPYVCQQRNVGCINGKNFLKAIGCNV